MNWKEVDRVILHAPIDINSTVYNFACFNVFAVLTGPKSANSCTHWSHTEKQT